MDERTTWFAVVDRRRGRLFEARRLPTGRLHVDERGQVLELWDEKQHHRPYMLSAHGRSVASFAHEDEERLRRFGRQLARWLVDAVREQAPSRLTVYCAPPLVGALRRSLPPRMLARLELRPEDLAGLTPGEMAAHPAVMEALVAP
jgi:protein required for attachment to host cells